MRPTRMPVRFLSALAALVALAAPASAQNVLGDRDSLTLRVDSIFRAFDRTDSPGCAIGVYRYGRILYARGYGMANLELGAPITARTVFEIASVTKPFTATAVLLLEQDGKLSLDDPASRHFPEMPPYANGITVRQLLNHTNGLRESGTLFDLAGRSFEGIADTLDMLRLIMRSAETNFPPGTRWSYSNSGYVLAGQLVYRLSGRSLGGFLKERVFDPLGMADTRYLDDHTMIVPGRAQAYVSYGAGFRKRMGQFDGMGASGVQTTVEDFARWDGNWESATVGGRPLVESMVVRGQLPKESAWGFGLGVFVGTHRGLRTVWHSGSSRGYRTAYIRFPDQHFSVACFCNVLSASAGALAREVATVYLGAQMAPDTSSAWRLALLAAPAVSLPVEQLRRFEGVWFSSEPFGIRRTRLEGGTLTYVQPWSPRELPLVPLGGNRFRVDHPARELVFEAEGTGRPQRVRNRVGSLTVVAEALDTVGTQEQLTAAQLAEYAGEYRSEEIETTYELAAEDDRLVIRIRGRRLGTLEASWRDGFMLLHEDGGTYLTGADLTGALFEFTRDGSGRITGFAIQMGGVRNLRLTRQR